MTIEKARKYFEKNGEIWADQWKAYDGVQYKHTIYKFTEFGRLEKLMARTKLPYHVTPVTRAQGRKYTMMANYGTYGRDYVITEKWHYVNHEVQEEIERQEQELIESLNGVR